MSDTATAPADTGLRYPFEAPEPGAAREVSPGVFWLRMPLPFSLDHINLYLLRDGPGWTLIDTGLGDPATWTLWERAFETVMEGRALTRVICTHMHPDHVGQAGALCRHFGVRLWMSRLEYVTARMLVADAPPAPDEALAFYRAAGWDAEALDTYKQRFGMFGMGVTPLPAAYQRIEDRDDIEIDGAVWRVIVGSGHSPEHVCLWNPEARLFLSGDQVIPKISSNVSVWPTEPAADPLSDWLSSCWRIMAAIPDDVLVLPSHNTPFYGLHTRLEGLIDGHERRLERLERSLETPKRVVDAFAAMFARPIQASDYSMATGETLAHLNYLVRAGRAVAREAQDGAVWFERSSGPARQALEADSEPLG